MYIRRSGDISHFRSVWFPWNVFVSSYAMLIEHQLHTEKPLKPQLWYLRRENVVIALSIFPIFDCRISVVVDCSWNLYVSHACRFCICWKFVIFVCLSIICVLDGWLPSGSAGVLLDLVPAFFRANSRLHLLASLDAAMPIALDQVDKVQQCLAYRDSRRSTNYEDNLKKN